MGNNALALNPLTSNIDITTHASDFLWAIFSIMAASGIGLLALGSTRPLGQRAFHHLAAAICFTASIAYFCMASDLGSTPIAVGFIRSGSLGANWVAVGVDRPTRSIWYARYIDWVITTPLLLLELLLATGLPLTEIFTTIFLDEVMIVTGLLGALVSSKYKWGLFFGCVAELYIWWMLLLPARKSANNLGGSFPKMYATSASILSALWLLYPVAWGLADGGNVITPTSEMVFYGVLDVLAKPLKRSSLTPPQPGFCFYHCIAMSKCDYNRLGFVSGKYSQAATAEERHYNTQHLNHDEHANEPRNSTATRVESSPNAAAHPGFKPTQAAV
ncbi:BZ3500_MvSof-1268-A1-R1_Chr9g10899 [Microbotryum saponariae]|uniref:BZ3500_MvSof-1268-A1-R1_Chr9g10899 protein n=1 Tax=Microbotryum saponariae TaxID=289078 RepID=A0A2X0M979_9BASI|nr:BZ3501_MvSof-1269-A2-R1_Chr9g10647 [Microbotryum saponariae]SDA00884.1 BZ3500_MvSof-1268-A1-R1_Chr9g10899 [Microbotryum saponariae]